MERFLFVLGQTWPRFLKGTWVTLYTSAFTVAGGMLLGLFVHLMRSSRFKVIRAVARAYVEIIRGTPILLQLWVFIIIPSKLGLELPQYASALIALVLNSGAYCAELIRSGIQSVDKGQTEAARSLGLSSRQTMVKVIIPQAMRNILPAMGNEFVMIIKETSLLSVFFIGDLMTVRAEVTSGFFLTIEPLIIVAVIYFVLTFTLSKIIEFFERRMAERD